MCVNITLRNKTREQRSHTAFFVVHFPLLRDISSSIHIQRRHGRISCSRHLRSDILPGNTKLEISDLEATAGSKCERYGINVKIFGQRRYQFQHVEIKGSSRCL
jgi:hypothetical protein